MVNAMLAQHESQAHAAKEQTQDRIGHFAKDLARRVSARCDRGWKKSVKSENSGNEHKRGNKSRNGFAQPEHKSNAGNGQGTALLVDSECPKYKSKPAQADKAKDCGFLLHVRSTRILVRAAKSVALALSHQASVSDLAINGLRSQVIDAEYVKML